MTSAGYVPYLPVTSQSDIEEIERVPLEARMPGATTYELLSRVAEAQPGNVAIHWLPTGVPSPADRAFTYGELLHRVRQTANFLRRQGNDRHDVVAYLLPNLPETHFVLAGAQAACIVMPLNPLLEPGHLAAMVRAAGVRLLITARGGEFDFLRQKAGLVARAAPGLRVICVDTQDPHPDGFLRRLDACPGDRLEFGYDAQPGDCSSLLHTGGTTGTPKIARSTHWAEATQGWLAAALTHCTPADVTLAGLPLFHATALRVNGIATWAAGSSLVLLGPHGYRNPSAVARLWETIERYRVTTMMAVATVYSGLLKVPIGGHDISSLRFAGAGAAPLPLEIIEQFEKRFGVGICEGYGLTEGCCLSSLNPLEGPRKAGSVGLRVPYQQMKAAVLDDEGAYVRDCDTGEVGVLLLKGPNVTGGYLTGTPGLFAGDGWLNTGDLARQDEDGFFFITGRRKDLIIRSGHNIDPRLIETVLVSHPDVETAAAVGMPDIYAGELPVAYVTLRDGASVTAERLHEYAVERITERPAAPKKIFVIAEMPTTTVGKHFKVPLKCAAAEVAIADAVNDRLPPGTGVRVHAKPDDAQGIHVDIVLVPKPGTDRTAVESVATSLFRSFSISHTLEFEE
ncbi:acyl-CoA synthetase [Amycolatopsis pithecellobii]|uniref:Acyl-CoA synthetase n=1 Tax=Amycolatopsis pithecellobii TaxID=664692 RepID=A0A6N7YJJ7_9PSEU|nr:acyl-CoA synthetase [Amycolatopsis pithecellobii]MTD53085.1 acyl-CoA synthetase [Amycolatopsis pithecellobii]